MPWNPLLISLIDNVDYNDLKRLIKIRTTRGQGEAVTIPGHSNEAKALQAFEDEFFAQLVDQHQRVDLFVRSKAGEVNRRLIHLDKQVGQLHQRYALRQPGKISVKRLGRYAKAEEAAEKAGEEIRSLARFVSAQRLAFIKLLKKYKKWTSSSGLETRFRKKVLDRPTAFSKRDFEPLLTQYNDVLTAIRAPFEDGGVAPLRRGNTASQGKTLNGSFPKSYETPGHRNDQSSTRIAKKPFNSTAAELQAACQDGSDVDFDTALATLPLGRAGGKASYWIHPDNLVELHVLLLHYSRLRRTSRPNGAFLAADGSRCESRRQSSNGDGSSLANGGDDDAGLVICDDLQRFARRRSSAPISDIEVSPGRLLDKAAATVRYSSTGEAVVAVSTSLNNAVRSTNSAAFYRLRIKRKGVRHLFGSRQSQSVENKLLGEEHLENCESLHHVQECLNDHPEIQPLVQVQCKRTRFVGLNNGEAGGMWATLDRDIVMRKTPEIFFDTEEGNLGCADPEDGHFVRFPFAVLEVRYEGGFATDFLAALDETHLTERIRGFSMETHAVATLCKPQGMPPPYWLPALDQDLRKLPATVRTATSRNPTSQLSPGSSTSGRASTPATSIGDGPSSSGFSIANVQSSATSIPETTDTSVKVAPKRKKRIRKDRSLRQQIVKATPQKYWNEYDDGEENSDNEPFAIYIDPNKSASFPGFATIYKAASSLASHAKAASKKVRSWLRSSDQRSTQTSGPTDDGNPYFNEVATPEDDSDPDESPTDRLLYRNQNRHYATFRDHYILGQTFQARESLLARCCIASFVAAYVLLIVAALLASAGRRKAIFKVDIGVITGVVFSLVFAIAGVAAMLTRRENVGIAQKFVAFAALAVICAGTGVLLAGVVDG